MFWVLFVCTKVVSAAVILAPVTNTPYRLVFVTQANFPANAAASIAGFNTLVTNQANLNPTLANLGTTWTVIGSTASVDARDNTGTNPFVNGTGVAIYNTGGQIIANSNSDLWDGTLQNPVGFNQFGNSQLNMVFTGSNSDGTKVAGGELGNAQARFGTSGQADSMWIEFTNNFPNALGLYAMSGVLYNGAPMAPAAVPEPSTFLLLGAGAIGLIGYRRRRCEQNRVTSFSNSPQTL
jgi:hypothetical protein